MNQLSPKLYIFSILPKSWLTSERVDRVAKIPRTYLVYYNINELLVAVDKAQTAHNKYIFTDMLQIESYMYRFKFCNRRFAAIAVWCASCDRLAGVLVMGQLTLKMFKHRFVILGMLLEYASRAIKPSAILYCSVTRFLCVFVYVCVGVWFIYRVKYTPISIWEFLYKTK